LHDQKFQLNIERIKAKVKIKNLKSKYREIFQYSCDYRVQWVF